MSFKDSFKQFIDRQVEQTVELIFGNAHGYAMTKSGDITPEQQEKLDAIKEDLKELVYKQAVDNLTEEQLKDYKLDSPQLTNTNTCDNCGFDMGEGFENCGASEDGVCPECGQDSPETEKESIWQVPVCRTGYGSRTIEVLASSEEEAIERAIEEAGNHEFSENDADYSASDGAFKAFNHDTL
jgi:hypothetical protein